MEIEDIGRLGVWTWLDGMSAGEAVDFTGQLEAWGYPVLWMPEAVGREPFSLFGYLAARSETLIFANGISNIYARDPMALRATQQPLADLSGGRFILGLGVSHEPMVTGMRPRVRAARHHHAQHPGSDLEGRLRRPRPGRGSAHRDRRAARPRQRT